MGRRRPERPPSDRAIVAIQQAKTDRSAARWKTIRLTIVAAFAAASPVVVAILERGAPGVSVLTIVLIVLLAIGLPGAVTKMVLDARNMQRMEARIRDLELHNVRLLAALEGSRRDALPPPDRHG